MSSIPSAPPLIRNVITIVHAYLDVKDLYTLRALPLTPPSKDPAWADWRPTDDEMLARIPRLFKSACEHRLMGPPPRRRANTIEAWRQLPPMPKRDTGIAESVARRVHVQAPVHSLALCADGIHVAAGLADGRVAVIDADFGRAPAYQHHVGAVGALAWLNKSNGIVSGCEHGSVILCDTKTEKARALPGPAGEPVRALAVSRDDAFVAVACGSSATLVSLDAPDAPPLAVSSATPTYVRSLSFSESAPYLVVGRQAQATGLSSVQVWDYTRQETLMQVEVGPRGLNAAMILPMRGDLLAAVRQSVVRVAPKTEVGFLTGAKSVAWSMAVSLDETWAVVANGADATLSLLDLSAGGGRRIYKPGHKATVSAALLLPFNDFLVTASHDGTVRWHGISGISPSAPSASLPAPAALQCKSACPLPSPSATTN